MWDALLNNLPQTILILLAAFICGTEIYKNIKVWKQARQERVNEQIAEREHCLDIEHEFEKLHTKLDEMAETNAKVLVRLEKVEIRTQDLTESDKNDIRAWIVEQYHKFYVS